MHSALDHEILEKIFLYILYNRIYMDFLEFVELNSAFVQLLTVFTDWKYDFI